MRNSINFNYLECFYSLSKTLSFSKTAEELLIAQPAVSKQIKLLEQQVGSQLFIRTRQKVQLSKAGKSLYEKTWPLYNELCLRVDQENTAANEIKGEITFGCLEEVGEKVFIHALNKFKTKYPSIKFDVKFLKAFEIIEGIKSGAIDLGIVPNRIDQEYIREYEILEEEITLVTSKKNANNKIEKLTQLPFVAFRENDPLLEYYIKKVNPKIRMNKLNIDFMVNSHKSMIEVIRQQNLYAVLPTLSIKEELKSGRIVKVGTESIMSKLYLLHLDLEYVDKKTILLRDFLRDYVKDSL